MAAAAPDSVEDAILRIAAWEPRCMVPWRRRVFWLLSLLTVGTLAIVASWPWLAHRKARALSVRCTEDEADIIIVQAADGSFEVCPVEFPAQRPLELLRPGEARRVAKAVAAVFADKLRWRATRRMVVFRHTRYICEPEDAGAGAAALLGRISGSGGATAAAAARAPQLGAPAFNGSRFRRAKQDAFIACCDGASGLSEDEAASRALLFGAAALDIPIPPDSLLVIKECVHPFVMFQIWAVIIWTTEEYWTFSLFILVTALLSAWSNFRSLKATLVDIKRLSYYSCPVTVLRGGKEAVVDSSTLVPGDTVLISHEDVTHGAVAANGGAAWKAPVDLVLLAGHVTVNEAMLTGESTVVIKSQLPPHAGSATSLSSPAAFPLSATTPVASGGGVPRAAERLTLIVPGAVAGGDDAEGGHGGTGAPPLSSASSASSMQPLLAAAKAAAAATAVGGAASLLPSSPSLRAPAAAAPPHPLLFNTPDKHMVYGGSLIVQLRVPKGSRVTAVVAHTSFESVKGRLVLSILYPKQTAFKFLQQSLRFIGVLFIFAAIGMAINAQALSQYGNSAWKIVQRCLDAVTIVVPPSLPLALSVGVAYALVRLKKERVSCISPQLVNVAGKINAVCFDKTGTLTTDGLELDCLHTAAGAAFGGVIHVPRPGPTIEELDSTTDGAGVVVSPSPLYAAAAAAAAAAAGGSGPGSSPSSALRPTGPLLHLLASCHSLTRLEGTGAQVLQGDPLEMQTVAYTGALVQEPHTCPGLAERLAAEGWGRGWAPHGASDAAAPLPLPPFPDAALPRVPSVAGFSLGPFAAAAAATLAPPLAAPPETLSLITFPSSLSDAQIVVHRQFEFVPALQRMSVVASVKEGGAAAPRLWSFVKGSPEALHGLCDPTTLPPSYFKTLKEYTHKGLRVLAAGAKAIAPNDAGYALGSFDGAAPGDGPRSWAERGLSFIGFIVLENRLKPATRGVMERLRKEAGLGLAMITGDAAVTAVCVARACGILETGAPDPAAGGFTALRMAGGSAASVSAGSSSVSSSSSPAAPLIPVYIGDIPPAAGSAGTPGPHSPSSVSSASGACPVVWAEVSDETDTLDPVSLEPRLAARRGAPYHLALTGRALQWLRDAAEAEGALLTTAPARGAPSTADTTRRLLVLPSSWAAVYARAVSRAGVFARVSPEQKAAVVDTLQASGLHVMMVGDGANDSLALRAAHVGISLSTAEASVSAPFTSGVPDISCVPKVLCEGRGALATSTSCFNFLALYSFIQLANALLIVFDDSFLSNAMYLWQDAFLVFILAVTLGGTPSAAKLSHKRPSGRLLSPYNLCLCIGFILITFAMQGVVFSRVKSMPWYDTAAYPAMMPEAEDEEGVNARIPTTTSVFLQASFQYIAVALIFGSTGHPWKRPVYTNRPFTLWLLLITGVSLWLLLAPGTWAYPLLSLMALPHDWHVELLGWSALSFVVYFIYLGILRKAKAAGVFSASQAALRKQQAAKRAQRRGRGPLAADDGVASAEEGGGGVEEAAKPLPPAPGAKLHKILRHEWATKMSG